MVWASETESSMRSMSPTNWAAATPREIKTCSHHSPIPNRHEDAGTPLSSTRRIRAVRTHPSEPETKGNETNIEKHRHSRNRNCDGVFRPHIAESPQVNGSGLCWPALWRWTVNCNFSWGLQSWSTYPTSAAFSSFPYERQTIAESRSVQLCYCFLTLPPPDMKPIAAASSISSILPIWSLISSHDVYNHPKFS